MNNDTEQSYQGGVMRPSSGVEAMRRNPAFRGPVGPLDDYDDSNDHFALVYESREEQLAAAIPFIRQGLERGERCLYITDENSREDILEVMGDRGIDVDDALDSGALSILTKRDTYLRNGTFDPDEMLSYLEATIAEATEEYEALRVTGEMTWALADEPDVEDLLEYEAKLDRLYADADSVVLCQYNRERFPPEAIRDIIQRHPYLIHDNVVSHNVYYTPPAEYFGADEVEDEVDRMLGTLQKRTETENPKYELQRMKDRFEAVFEYSNDAIFINDPHADEIIDANPAGLEMLGYDREELLSRGPSDCHPNEMDKFQAFVDGVFEEGYGWTDELTCRTKDGEEIPAEISASAIELKDRKLMLALVRDISERKQHEQYQRDLYDIMSAPDLSFEEKVRHLLELGRDRFDLDIGYFTRTHDDETFEVVDALGDHDMLEPGATDTLCDTYCEKLLASTGSIAVRDAAEAGWNDDRAYETYGLDAYFATTVHVGGDEYGTLCFASETPREHPYTEAERTYLELMGQWIEYELKRKQRERYLRKSYQITSDPNLGFEEKLGRLLELGRERLGLDAAGLTYLPEWDGEFLTEYAIGNSGDGDGAVDAADEVWSNPGDGCFCRKVVTEDEPVGMADVRGTDWEEDPIHKEQGLSSYIGTKVTNGTTPYGTLWIGSTEPRDSEFSEAERTFLELMGQWVSYEIERREHKQSQRDLYEITANTDLSTDEKIEELLEVGRERLNLSVGMLTREREQAFEIRRMLGSHPDLDEGTLTPPLTDNYCRRVVETGETICVADAGSAGWDGDALYHEFDLQSYAGTQVSIGDHAYGTICFTDLSPRERSFTEAEQAFLELLGQCASYELERSRRETRLHVLNEISRELMDAETAPDVAEDVIDTLEDAFARPVVAVALYNRESGTLQPTAQTDDAKELLETNELFDGTDSVGWAAFTEGETKRVTDLLSRGDVETAGQPSVPEAVVHPLGTHGVLLVGSQAPNGFSRCDTEIIETAAANIRAALDRTNRERKLQEREQTLEEQNESLARLNRINDTIRNIDQALVESSTRAEIEEAVCDELAASGPYELAWVGDYDGVTEEVTPAEWAGSEKGYLSDIRVTADDTPEGSGPVGRAVKTGEPQVVNDILTDESFEPWRQNALNRGYHAGIALPLIYESTLYGVLAVYAGQPNVFDELEQSVLAETASTIAYALNAVESKKALVSDEVTRLEFAIDDTNLEIVELARELDCEFSMESLIPRTDGGLRVFFSTRGAPAEEVLEFGSRLAVSDLRLISACDEGDEPFGLFDASLDDSSLCATVTEHGGQPRAVTVQDGTAMVTVDLAPDAEVRKFVEMFQKQYPESELLAQRNHERLQQTPTEFYAGVTEELTARQLEAVQTAFFGGYFEEPRTQSANEIADTMEIAQSTFSSHLRAAHRKVYQQLFDEDSLLA